MAALWGGRFSNSRDEKLKKFSESISFDKRLYKHDIAGSRAHVKMLAAQKIIPTASSEKILSALNEIEDKIARGMMEFSPELEDIHMHIENELIKMVGPEGARLHTGRSRNDQVALDIRLFLRDETTRILCGIRRFQFALTMKAKEYSDAIMPGFTHLQHAQPVLFAHHLMAYVEMFERDIARLEDCRERFNVMPLGSGAIAGSTLPLNREMTAKLLDFSRISNNSMDAVADRDFICEFISSLAIFAMHVSRISEDIVIWCSQEFGFIELDDAFCTGSSLMPQKKNPDIAELSRGKTGRIYGSLMAILTLCKGLPLAYNRDLQEDKEPLFDAIDSVGKILSVYPEMIETAKIRRERMLSAASDPELMATDLAEYLVKKGVPFRDAHHKVGKLVKWAREKNRRLDELSFKEIKSVIGECGRECMQLFSPEKSVAAREIPGGTGFKEVSAQIRLWEAKLKKIRNIKLLECGCKD